jgi:hypothetical protein
MLSKKVLQGDEELGKKNDDHRYGSTPRINTWSFLKRPLRWRRRRILLVVMVLYTFYMCVKYFPDFLSWTPHREGWQFEQPIVPIAYDNSDDVEPTGAPKGTKIPRSGEPKPHTYSGLVKFYRLANSLHGASHTNGYSTINRNVLFAVSNLQSASTILPIVCEMSRWNRNWVHVAFMGREDIDIGTILEINGIDQIKCPAIWHDARPDFSEYSTDTRAESSVRAALMHINSFLHPQVLIMDDALSEDDFFVRGVRAKTKALGMPLMEGAQGQWDNLMWMARLDAGSLKNWHRPSVEILVQVPHDSSGVIRLLKSIKDADYSGLKLPHITVELPAEVDESVEDYLKGFRWPPTGDLSQISIRRRIARRHANQQESAIRFLELFFPTDPVNSHVLLLSPQAELSSQYYHYLMYALLEYRYSALGNADSIDLMGISLELPSVLLDGKTKLTPPKITDMQATRYQELFPDGTSPPFLWQAPNSHATLFFGDKWAELHSFLSNRVAKHSQASKAAPRHKLVSEMLPSWVEYVLEFMRARGYALFYPGASFDGALVRVHNELYHAPEEFSPPKTMDESTSTPPEVPDEAFLRAEEPAPRPKFPESEILPRSVPLHLILPFDGDLPEMPELPYLLHTGRPSSLYNASTIASTYADRYRQIIGGCKPIKDKHRKMVPGSTRDLFCFGDEDVDDWEDNNPELPEDNYMYSPTIDRGHYVSSDGEPKLLVQSSVSIAVVTPLPTESGIETSTAIESVASVH